MSTTHLNAACPILCLPNEILVDICAHLDVDDLLALGQTCREASQQTRDQSIWFRILREYERSLPLPAKLRKSLLELQLLEKDLQSIVVMIRRIAVAWFQPKQAIRLHRPTNAGQVVGLELFMERWLFSIHKDGQVLMWDIACVSETHKPRPVRLLNLGTHELWHVATYDKESHSVILVISATSTDHGPTYTRIYRVPLPHAGRSIPGPAEYLRGIETEVNHKPKMVDVSKSLIVFSRPTIIDVVYWGGDGPESSINAVAMDMVSFSTEPTVFGGLFDQMNAIRVVGPYLIVFKFRSIEIYPLRPRKNVPTQLLAKHSLSPNTFREMLLSDLQISPMEGGDGHDSTISFSFMGYDVLEGLSRFEVTIQSSSDYAISPLISVDLANVYPLTHSINVLTPPNHAPAPPLPAPAPPPAPTALQLFPANGRHTYPSARGFISSYALGAQGARAVWIERSRGKKTWDFITWGKSIPGTDDQDSKEMEKKVVYTITSPVQEMRELDIDCCALGECSGRIAYANLIGQIYVIPATRACLALEQVLHPPAASPPL